MPAAAAAALIVVSGLFAFGVLPSGNVTIKEFGNTTDRVRSKTLADGTRLAIAPGAKLVAAGRDSARKVRQVIKLESGEVEVRAPKAVAGEVACRVETPEGLWVETVGTVFRVTRAWENERGERNVDKSKLAGVLTAVLLVAVTEGEVRTGNAIAEEARVAVGSSVVVKEGPGKAAAASVAGESLAFGPTVNGFALGLAPSKRPPILPVYAPSEPVKLRLVLRAGGTGSDELRLLTGGLFDGAGLRFKVCRKEEDGRWSQPKEYVLPEGHSFYQDMSPDRFVPGKERASEIDLKWLDFVGELSKGEPGEYRVSVVFVPRAADAKKSVADGWAGKELSSGWAQLSIDASAEPKVSWGQAENGLQAGLSARQTQFEAGKPMEFTAHYRNAGKDPVVFYRSGRISVEADFDWLVVMKPKAGGTPHVPAWEGYAMKALSFSFEPFGAGEQRSFVLRFGKRGFCPAKDQAMERAQHHAADRFDKAVPLPVGTYLVTATFRGHCDLGPGEKIPANFWRGSITTGPVEIEVVASSEEADAAEAGRIGNLIRRLADVDFRVREESLKALVAMKRKAVPALQKALGDRDPEVSNSARQALEAISIPPEWATFGQGEEFLGKLAPRQEMFGNWKSPDGDDVVATRAALKAFLDAGYSESFGRYQDNVRRAQQWLKQQEQKTAAHP
ncbi:MAG TPA: FecR domain-containing protein [Planctomycetota bacterium]|nr:FecR domain-containing protein [Planctomycetota bacterium]